MESKFVFLSDTNQLYNSLIATPNLIDHSTEKLDNLDIYVGLDSFKTKGGDGAKIVHQVTSVPQTCAPPRRRWLSPYGLADADSAASERSV